MTNSTASDAQLAQTAWRLRGSGITEGKPFPLGATWDGLGVNFALFSAHATKVELCLFDNTGETEIERIELPEYTDEVWHGYLLSARPGPSTAIGCTDLMSLTLDTDGPLSTRWMAHGRELPRSTLRRVRTKPSPILAFQFTTPRSRKTTGVPRMHAATARRSSKPIHCQGKLLTPHGAGDYSSIGRRNQGWLGFPSLQRTA